LRHLLVMCNVTGVTTTNSLSIDATQVLSSARQLQNIASLDATTTATIESAIQLAPNDFNSLNISGISTFAGITTVTGPTLFTNQLSVSGITTFAGITTVTGPTLFTNQLSVSGITTFAGAIDANGDLDVDGDTELDNVNISGTLNVVGVSTFAGITTVTGTTLFAKQLNVSGVVTATTFIGALTGTATTTTNIPNLTGDVTSTGNATSIAAGVIVDADISSSAAISLSKLDTTGNIVSTQLNVTGLSTFAGITTVTGPTLFAKQLNVSGVSTSIGGFTSGIGVTNPVKITVSGNILSFTVAGVGSTSLILY
jgi:hypothetical protein